MASTAAAPAAINPRDFLGIDHLLSDEERDIRDTVRAFVRDRVVPHVGDWFEQATLPDGELAPRAGQARRARHAPAGLRLRRRERDRLRPRVHGARGRRQRPALARLRAGLARDVRDLALGQRGAEAALAAADGRRRGDRLLRADRARRRLGPRLDAHARPPRRQRLDPARAEDVDHQRLDRRRRRRVGGDRRGHARLPRAARHRRASRTQDIHRKLSLRASVTSELLLDDVRLPAGGDAARGDLAARAAVVPERGALRDRLGRRRRRARVLRSGARTTARSGSPSAARSPRRRSSSTSSRRWRSRSTARRCSRCTSAA